MKKVFLVQLDDRTLRGLYSETVLNSEIKFEEIGTSEEIFKLIKNKIFDSDLSALVIGSGVKDPIQTAQRIHTVYKEISIVLLSSDYQRPTLCRAIQFSPFLGENVVCVSIENTSGIIAAVREMAQKAKLRKEYQSIVNASNLRLTSTNVNHSDVSHPTFLGSVLDQAPIGIANLSSDLRVLAWNRCAFEMTQKSEREMIGQDFLTLFPVVEKLRLKRFLSPEKIDLAEKEANLILSRVSPDGKMQFLEVTCSELLGRGSNRGFLVLFQDITERRRLDMENTYLLSRLREAIRARDEFFSIASHELKTPITSLRLRVQLQQRRLNEDPSLFQKGVAFDRFWESILSEVDRLSRLIEDMLDISRLTHGKLDLKRESFDFGELVSAVLESFSEEMKIKCGPPIIKIEPSIIGCWDRARVEQVVVNLITNALKYGRNNPIEVSVKASGSWAVFQVRDEGLGIAEDNFERIFHRFERVSSSKAISGLGLGLYICRQIVEAHGGRIRVESVLGEGSIFSVELPLS